MGGSPDFRTKTKKGMENLNLNQNFTDYEEMRNCGVDEGVFNIL
jgi:hypothetical protein